jgi:hypothetical protein
VLCVAVVREDDFHGGVMYGGFGEKLAPLKP